ncbi:uncharacterized protein A1O9_12099 [Exophiala aquamarina CBS 119918]|uniref:catechol O-methyltransferase n=1 Tax=Exophiala aquamarina CBS 119918 TaxID=1182545 RepID=A0A072NWJ5_9EURO|nr:uncharacterized protein A1O9_12099 [Exophiala aquamarina CBS 119918]KEF51762.1 hypothetical protein A1O9_12099 [Exophiala aquamarina CBS 119918]
MPKRATATFFNDGREQELHEYILSRPDLETGLRNNPKAIVHAIEEFTRQQRMIIYSETKLEKSRSILAEMDPPPKVLLEAGTYVGNSAIAWGDMLRTINGGNAEGVKVYTFELDEEFVKIARELVELAGLSDIVTVIQGKSTDSIRTLKEESGLDQIDVLFLDHWEEAYLPDLQLCEDLALFHKGSVVLADNTDYPGAPEYVKYVKAGGRGEQGHVKYESVSYATASKAGAPVSISLSSGCVAVEVTDLL